MTEDVTEKVYRGWATVLDHGFEIVVHADLAARPAADGGAGWGGHLKADRDEDFELIAKVRDAQLRLPDGTEADFVAVESEVGRGGLQISGTAAAPF